VDLHKEKIYDVFITKFYWLIKSRRMRGVGVKYMGEGRDSLPKNIHNIVIGWNIFRK